jgi:hypothetical protein
MRNYIVPTIFAAALAWGGSAHAGLLVEFSTDGGATFTTLCSGASGTSCSSTTNVPGGLDYTIIGATSNSPGTPTLADLLSASVQITNPETTTQSVELLIGDTGFTHPTAPPTATFSNSLSTTTVTGGAANLISSFACISETNGQNTCPGNFDTAAISNNITGTVSHDSAGDAINLASLTSPYSMTQEITLTLAPGSNFNFVDSTQIASAVPEPSTLALFGAALLGTFWYRRRA